MLKRIKTQIDLETTEKILSVALNNGSYVSEIEGVLNDSYLINNYDTETGNRIRIGKRKPRKYLILTHEFASSWSNNLYLIETDSDEEAENFMKEYYKFIDEMED